MIFMSCGCAELDLYPLDTGSSDSWYRNESEIQMSIMGLYRTDFWPIDNTRWSDDHQSRTTLNIITGGTINSETGEVATRWQNAYKAIARANTLLEKLENAEALGIVPEQAALYRAQTLFARAGQYAILTTYFGDVPYVEKQLTIEEAFKIGRTDRAEIMEHVYRDFDEAARILPLSYDNGPELATKGAAYALKARYALYNEDWEIAAEAARNCMELEVYSLYPDFSELFLASTKKASENIFSWPRSIELNQILSTGQVMGYVTRNRGGYASEYPTWELFCSFLCTDGKPIDESPLFDPHNPFRNRDPRCAATIVEFETEHLGVLYDPNPLTTSVWNSITQREVTNQDTRGVNTYASYNGLVLKKGVDEAYVNDNTFKVDPDRVFIRLADVMLIYAEAMIEANQIDQTVLDAINRVRARAYKVDYTDVASYPAVTTTDRDELRRIVRTERRMEFAFEGGRYMDLIRWKLAEKTLNLADYGLLDKTELIEKVVEPGLWFYPFTPQIDEDGVADFKPMYDTGLVKLITQRNFDPSKHYLWPIPSREVITNPNLGQNDNY